MSVKAAQILLDAEILAAFDVISIERNNRQKRWNSLCFLLWQTHQDFPFEPMGFGDLLSYLNWSAAPTNR